MIRNYKLKQKIKELPIVYFDLDGSMLNKDNKIEKEVEESIKKYKRMGGHIGIATGRSYLESIDFIKQIQPDMPCTFLNGRILYDNGDFIHASDFPRDIYKYIKDQLCEDFFIIEEYINEYRTASRLEARLFSYELQKNMKQIVISDNETINKKLTGIYIMHKKGMDVKKYLANFQKSLGINSLSEFYDEFNTLKMSDKWWCLRSRKGDKEVCLDYLYDRYGIEENKIAYFGNDWNDINMFKRSGIRIADKDSVEELLKMANCVIENNEIPDLLDYFYTQSKCI